MHKRKQVLVEGRLDGEFDSETYAAMSHELRERETRVVEDLEALGLQESEDADLAVEVFEQSQDLQRQWVAADEAAKRRILKILSSDWTLEGKILTPVLRKPFDVLVRGFAGAMGGSGEPQPPELEPSSGVAPGAGYAAQGDGGGLGKPQGISLAVLSDVPSSPRDDWNYLKRLAGRARRTKRSTCGTEDSEKRSGRAAQSSRVTCPGAERSSRDVGSLDTGSRKTSVRLRGLGRTRRRPEP